MVEGRGRKGGKGGADTSERARNSDPDARSRQRSRLAQMRPLELDEFLEPLSSSFFFVYSLCTISFDATHFPKFRKETGFDFNITWSVGMQLGQVIAE